MRDERQVPKVILQVLMKIVGYGKDYFRRRWEVSTALN